jgi:hypothetical protein
MEIRVPMDRRIKISGIAIGIVAFVSAIVFCYFFIIPNTHERPAQSKVHKESGMSPLALLLQNDSTIDKMVSQLKKYYGKQISDKSLQTSLISLRDFILGTHPVNGKAFFYDILKRAFPDYADEIMKTLDKMDQYNRWLEDNKTMLSQMTEEERAAALWKKRRELFGDDAEKIWTGDMLSSELRKAKFKDTLSVLDKSNDTTLDEKLEMYQGSLHETFKGSPEELLLDEPNMLSKIFFSIDSVQDVLKQMNPEQRQWEINNIRRKMGIPEQQIENMAARDADNEQRWQIGLEYMQKRDEVVQTYQGTAQEEQLNALRELYFKDEANTIELEEKDNFFRFKRPHIYGRN